MNKSYYVKGISIPMDTIPATPGAATKLKYRTVRREINIKHSWAPNRKYHMSPQQRATDSELTPNDGVVATPDMGSFWSPSGYKNEDLWMPFYAIHIRNISEFGKNEEGGADINTNPVYLQWPR